MNFIAIIPARYASIRLPGKPLLDLGGKPMVVRVAEAAAASGATDVWVATDDERVFTAVQHHGCKVCMTSANHSTGTDRIAEVVRQLNLPDDQIVVNVQGDEPLIAPQLINDVALDLAQHPDAALATVCHPLIESAAMFNPNVVKVVRDAAGYAMYFSRAPIPFARDAFTDGKQMLPAQLPVYHHIGLYAYRVSFLKRYPELTPALIEQFEALEQLRALWHGFRISVMVTEHAPGGGVDTLEDLARVRKVLSLE